jgi:hypothetical protein
MSQPRKPAAAEHKPRVYFRGALALLLLLAACAAVASETTIGEIQGDPPAYEGKNVTVNGEVVSRLSLILWKTYTIKDDSAEITVVTKKAMPNVGAQVEVTGRVEEGFSLGATQTLVIMDESAQND